MLIAWPGYNLGGSAAGAAQLACNMYHHCITWHCIRWYVSCMTAALAMGAHWCVELFDVVQRDRFVLVKFHCYRLKLSVNFNVPSILLP